MTAEHKAIKVAYENESMLPDEIASDRGLEVASVKACLMQVSSKYRKDCGQEPESEDRLNFSNDDLERVNEVIMALALSAENEKVRLAAATYVRDDKKGRKEVVKGFANQQTNIFMINEQMKRVREMATTVKGQING